MNVRDVRSIELESFSMLLLKCKWQAVVDQVVVGTVWGERTRTWHEAGLLVARGDFSLRSDPPFLGALCKYR